MTEEPDPKTFAELKLDPQICADVSALGFEKPTPIQEQAIPVILEGSDMIGIAQTGTGKTAAFVLPIIQLLKSGAGGPRALVISPTRELAQQTYDAVLEMGKSKGTSAAIIIGGESYSKQLTSLRAQPDFVVGTPGRISDQMERKQLLTKEIEVVVLDEADRLLDMGFYPQLEFIINRLPRKRQTLLFSATMPPAIERLAQRYLTDPKNVSVGLTHTAVEGCVQELYLVAGHDRATLLKYLIGEDEGSVLVFTKTKRGADDVYRHLRAAGYSVAVLHGDLRQETRVKATQDFRSGKIRILVATNIAARGLDIDGIERVVNYDVPDTVEDYLHRIGRTARAERTGHASTFSSFEDSSLIHSFEKEMGQKIPVKIVTRDDLNAFTREEIAREYANPTPTEEKPRKASKPRRDQPNQKSRQGRTEPEKQEQNQDRARRGSRRRRRSSSRRS